MVMLGLEAEVLAAGVPGLAAGAVGEAAGRVGSAAGTGAEF